MAASVVATGGNESYSATGSVINLGTFSLQPNDTVLVVEKWEGSTAVPALNWQGANLGKAFVAEALLQHPTLPIWFRAHVAHQGFASSTNEQLTLDLDSGGGGRAGWCGAVYHMRGLSGGLIAMNFASCTAPGSGSTTLAASGSVAVGAGDGIIVQIALADDDCGTLTLAGTFSAASFNSAAFTYFKRGQHKIYNAASGAVTPSATVANPVALGLLTFAFGAPTAGNPTVDITSATQDGDDLVVEGTYTATGTPTINVTATPSSGTTLGPTAATLIDGSHFSIRFAAPAASTYGISVGITDSIGTGSDSASGVVISAASLAAPVITSAPDGLSPIHVTGTGVPGCTIDLRIDGSAVNSNVATVDANGLWSCNVSLSTGTRTLEARQNTVPTADGNPPTPGPLTITPQSDPAQVQFSWVDNGQPRTRFNLFRYAAADTADGDGTLVASTASTSILLASPLSGWYSIGAENNNGNAGSPWYSHKSARVQYTAPGSGGGGGDTPIPSTDTPTILGWITPDTAFASTVTGGSFQCDSATNRNVHLLAGYSAGVSGATHSATGILYPGGSGGDQAYALSRTTVAGKPRFHHRIGSAIPVSIGGTTFRSEFLMNGGLIDRGDEWIAGSILRIDSNMLAAGAPFISWMDLHHEQGAGYNGPGPCGLWGDRNGLHPYWRRGVDGSWHTENTAMPSLGTWVPEAGHDYFLIWHGKQDTRAGFGAFLRFYRVVDDEVIGAPRGQINEPWGVDTYYDSITSMFWKRGMYGFTDPGAGPFSSKSGGLIVVRAGGSTGYTPARMLATLRALA